MGYTRETPGAYRAGRPLFSFNGGIAPPEEKSLYKAALPRYNGCERNDLRGEERLCTPSPPA